MTVAILEIAGASLWIVAAVVQLVVFRYELRVLREMREERRARDEEKERAA